MTSSGFPSRARLVSIGAAAVVLGGLALAGPAAAHPAAAPEAVGVSTFTAGRLFGSVAALVALAGVVLGGLALLRPAGGRGRAVAALVAGLVGITVGTMVVALAKGGPGTGYGIVGGYAALAIGVVAAVLGGTALARSRRAG